MRPKSWFNFRRRQPANKDSALLVVVEPVKRDWLRFWFESWRQKSNRLELEEAAQKRSVVIEGTWEHNP